jgi:hypothetical protein
MRQAFSPESYAGSPAFSSEAALGPLIRGWTPVGAAKARQNKTWSAVALQVRRAALFLPAAACAAARNKRKFLGDEKSEMKIAW